MATVFELPMPVLDDPQTQQTNHRRRPRDSVEVIDVDELDDDIYQTHRPPGSGPSRPAHLRRLTANSEIISLVDSDDEEDIVVSESSTRPASRTRLQSPPPPSQSWGFVPPVPPVPHRYAGHTSLPMRRHGPAYSSPPVIRPIDQPFPFETNMRPQQPHHQLAPLHGPGPSNRPPQLHIPRLHHPDPLPPRALQLQPAPPSHHIPSMGLGGALIAQNRPRHHNHNRTHPYEAGQSLLGRVGSGVRRIFNGPPIGPGGGPHNFVAIGNNFGFFDETFGDGGSDADRMLALQMLAEEEGEGLREWDSVYNPTRVPRGFREVLRNRNHTHDEPPYKSEYTHPSTPEKGFTFNFTPKTPEVIDFTSPPVAKKRKSSQGSIVIIDDDDDAVTKAGSRANYDNSIIQISPTTTSFSKLEPQSQVPSKPFLACARCLDPLVLGSHLTSEEQKSRRVWGLRCGHLIDGKCLKEIGQPYYTDQPTILGGTIDRKGKGKAKAVAEDVEYHDASGVYDHDSESNSIRSRLRPRRVANSASSHSAQTSVKRNARTKAAMLPMPEYIWHCPVTGCGREHISIKVNGEWIPERDDSIYTDSSTPGGGRNRRGGRGKSRANLYGLLNDPDNPNPTEGPRGAIPLFL